jgi:pyrroline-5-carboxylate reductase
MMLMTDQQTPTRFAGSKIAVLGCGQIGESLVRGMIASGFAAPTQIHVTTRRAARAAELEAALGVVASTDNVAAARGAEVILVAVKPKLVLQVLSEVASALGGADPLVISVAAAVDTATIEARIGQRGVIRAMPNLAVVVRQGVTSLARGRFVTDVQAELAHALFASVGRTVDVEEQNLNAVTALSGSGPAFIFMVIESLAEGGVRMGLPREVALELAAQTVVGAGAMVLATGEHPAKLKDAVTTPAGCTVDGILQLEEGGLRVALIKAVSYATLRAGELADAK